MEIKSAEHTGQEADQIKKSGGARFGLLRMGAILMRDA
jgi:hypothetical protein